MLEDKGHVDRSGNPSNIDSDDEEDCEENLTIPNSPQEVYDTIVDHVKASADISLGFSGYPNASQNYIINANRNTDSTILNGENTIFSSSIFPSTFKSIMETIIVNNDAGVTVGREDSLIEKSGAAHLTGLGNIEGFQSLYSKDRYPTINNYGDKLKGLQRVHEIGDEFDHSRPYQSRHISSAERKTGPEI